MQLSLVRNILSELLFVKEGKKKNHCQNRKAFQNQLLSLEHFPDRGEMEEKYCLFLIYAGYIGLGFSFLNDFFSEFVFLFLYNYGGTNSLPVLAGKQ